MISQEIAGRLASCYFVAHALLYDNHKKGFPSSANEQIQKIN